MTAKRPPIRKRRKHNLPDPLPRTPIQPKEDERAREQARLQLESVRQLVERLRVAQEQAETGPDETEAAQQSIHEDALSVEVRSGWTSAGEKFQPEEYRIVLCTGGPHVEIYGSLDHHNQPLDAAIRYQDWFTEYRTLPITTNDEGFVQEYAQQFYYG